MRTTTLVLLVVLVSVASGAIVPYSRYGASLSALTTTDWTMEDTVWPISADIEAYIWMDHAAEEMTMAGFELSSLAPDVEPVYNASMSYFADREGWLVLNGQCRPSPPSSLFTFLTATWASLEYVGEVQCDFSIVDAGALPALNYTLCQQYTNSAGFDATFLTVAEVDGQAEVVPIFLAFSSNVTDGPSSMLASSTYSFTDFWLGELPANALAEPSLCSEPAYYCDEGPVLTLDMLRFHTEDDFSLAQRNTADLAGEVSFVCLMPPDSEDSLLSYFSVETNTTWGQYGMCNDGICVGGSPGAVGHEGANHYGMPKAGQCSTNDGIGNWFSLTSDLECTQDQDVGEEGCGWKVAEWHKTVTHQCLLDQGLFSACALDGKMPYPSAQVIVQRAMASEDPEQGGCPDVTNTYFNGTYSWISSSRDSSDDSSGDDSSGDDSSGESDESSSGNASEVLRWSVVAVAVIVLLVLLCLCCVAVVIVALVVIKKRRAGGDEVEYHELGGDWDVGFDD